MKYYAVTEDPNELMHFGIKGMKWGVIRTPEQLGHHKEPKKPRSPAYMKASAKLSKAMRQGIAKAQNNWKVYNSPENKQIRAENREINKQVRAYKKGEKNFQKHLQLAREGRLKYKGISDDEIGRITDRLMLERQSRSLSGAEGKRFRTRMAESIGEGIVQGVGQGVSTRMSEFVGRGSRLKTQRLMNEQNEYFAKKRAKREADARRKERREEERHQQQVLDQQNARDEQEKLDKLIEANRIMDYGSAYDNGMDLNFESGRQARKLTSAQRQARIAILEDAKKLYGTKYDTKVKAKNGAKTVKKKDPETGEEIEETVYVEPQNRPQVKEHNSGAAYIVYRKADTNKSKILDSLDTPRKVVMASGKTKDAGGRSKIREALDAQHVTRLPANETERYRQGMQKLLAEAEAREARASRQEAEAQRQAEQAQKARAREEGFAYYKDRRVTRESSPSYAIREASSAAVARANRQQHREELALATQQRATERLRDAQVRTARQNEQQMFNGRTIPSATYPDYTIKRKGRKTGHASISDIYNLRG